MSTRFPSRMPSKRCGTPKRRIVTSSFGMLVNLELVIALETADGRPSCGVPGLGATDHDAGGVELDHTSSQDQ